MHELATNAAKYGALVAADGSVEIEWSLNRHEIGKETFVICWRESGGPPVTAPTRSGFGSSVLRDMARVSLNANVQFDFLVTGLSWRLECPAAEVMDGNLALSQAVFDGGAGRSLSAG